MTNRRKQIEALDLEELMHLLNPGLGDVPQFKDRLDARRRITSGDEPPVLKRADDGTEYDSIWVTELQNAWRMADAGMIPLTEEIKLRRFDRSIQPLYDQLEPGTLPITSEERRGADCHAVLQSLCELSLNNTRDGGRHTLNLMISMLGNSYAYGLPNRQVLDRITQFSGGQIIELGAGKGYWARLLSNLGCDVQAYDEAVPGQSHWTNTSSLVRLFGKNAPAFVSIVEDPWFDVEVASVTPLRDASPARTLLMVWPSKHDFATEAVRLFRGDKLVYVGEPRGLGCAEDSFFDAMQTWDLVDVLDIPRMPWNVDRAFLYQRTARSRSTGRRGVRVVRAPDSKATTD